jgi:PAS domain S-box-containing protein
MKYKLQDLIDMDHFQNLQDRLNEIYSFPSAIIDNEGTVLTATAWQDICVQFHRKNKDCEQDCIQSDKYIQGHLHEANPAVSYRCPRGLVDNATPIIIDGIHYGNFFTGQFFLEKPDREFFRAQAKKYGFDEDAYLEAVRKVPIWTKKQLNSYLFFIKGLIAVISENGLKKLKETETREQIEDSEERADTILREMHEGFWMMNEQSGQILDANEAMCRMLGYTHDELLNMSVADVEANDLPEMIAHRIQDIMQTGSAHFESRFRRKDGTIIDVEVSITHLPKLELFFGFHRDITERKRAERETAILADIGRLIASTLEIDEVYDRFAAEANKLIPFDRISVNLINPDGKSFTNAYVSGLDIPYRRPGTIVPLARSLSEIFMQNKSGRIIHVENAEDLVRQFPSVTASLVVQAGIRSMIGIPLIYRDEIIGSLHFRSIKPNVYTEYDLRLAERIGMQIAGAIATAQLYSDLRKTETYLRENEERFRTLFEHAAVGIAEVQAGTGRFLAVNRMLCEIVGRTEEEMLATTFMAITHPEDANLHTSLSKRMYDGEFDHYTMEKRYIRKDGGVIWVNLTISRLWKYGETPGRTITIVYDITDRKRMEEELRKSEIRYRTLFERATDGIFIISTKGKLIEVNEALARMHGYRKDEMQHMRLKDLDAPESIQMVPERLRRLLTGEALTFEVEHYHKDGHVFPLEVSASLISCGGESSIQCFHRDITDRKRAEEEKKRLEERLQRAEKMEALGQLAGGVAHDLNNILGILSGYSELLLEEIPEESRSRGHAEKILQSTEKGAAIIQDLLTLARRGVTASDVINLNSVVSGFLKTPVFEKITDYNPRVTFRTECDKNLLNIKGSPVHLEKALMNLVSNAAESISGTGEVTIRTENRYLDKAVRGYDEVKEGDYTVLTVSDTGTGIPVENREKIFEPFYTKKTMGRSGTGLGLAIVWGTVKDHNGYIDLQTEVGEGTTFTLYFPVTREELIAPQLKVPVERYMGNGEAVLVVDDIAEQRDIAARLLARLGYQVHLVSSGEEAVEYLTEHKADILVLDMIMAPGIDGLETYQRVLEIHPKQKAILVSGFSETERVREAQKLGAGAYVKKPYLMEKIGVAIRDELNR